MTELIKNKQVRNALASPYKSLVLGGVVIDNIIQPLVNKFVPHEYMYSGLISVVNRVGDVSNGALVYPLMLAADAAINQLDERGENQLCQTLKKISPFLLTTLMAAWVIDAETVRALPLSLLSFPEWQDIPAGLFGVLAGALLYETRVEKKITK